MDNDVSAGSAGSTGSTASTLGHLALGLTLLAFGIGGAGVIDGVTAADAAALATWVGGVALFAAGLFALREGDGRTGTAFAGLGAFWFAWGTGVGAGTSAKAGGLFLVLWALLALSMTAAASGGGPLGQGVYGLLTVSLLLSGIGAFADASVLGRIGGWTAAVAGLAAWYGATASLAKWPTFAGRAAGRGVTATG
ncbi:GPR1/FUN34/YaaH family transporter [Streptomyces sp. NPDC016309]|uniref:GPR1/FUN34/YaaH family transporter n=1 Tax=Streptomyces sp. NPDC016309 TaxID=3364965 RepID=UPI0036FEFD8A